MVSTIAMLAGGILGVFLRNILDGPHTTGHPQRRRSLTIRMLGGLLLGTLTGATITTATSATGGNGSAAALTAGLSGLLLTYCVFSSAATHLIKTGPRRDTILPAILSALIAFAAATAGVTLGITLAS